MLLCAVTRPWPRRLDGRPPSSRCCSPLVAATLARAARARSVGRRVRDGSTLGRRSTRRPAPPALNAARLLRRASLRGHTPVAATARRPPAVESLLLAARRGDARARCSRPLGRPPRSRRLDTRPPLDAAACASCAKRGAWLARRRRLTAAASLPARALILQSRLRLGTAPGCLRPCRLRLVGCAPPCLRRQFAPAGSSAAGPDLAAGFACPPSFALSWPSPLGSRKGGGRSLSQVSPSPLSSVGGTSLYCAAILDCPVGEETGGCVMCVIPHPHPAHGRRCTQRSRPVGFPPPRLGGAERSSHPPLPFLSFFSVFRLPPFLRSLVAKSTWESKGRGAEPKPS